MRAFQQVQAFFGPSGSQLGNCSLRLIVGLLAFTAACGVPSESEHQDPTDDYINAQNDAYVEERMAEEIEAYEDEFGTLDERVEGAAQAAERARIVSVTDGDTIVVTLDSGVRAKVRIIGIDTPETYPAYECGGGEATANMKAMLSPGDAVRLHSDLTQDEIDRYGRLLRYVFKADKSDVGLTQIQTGHARSYIYGGIPFAFSAKYEDAEKAAQATSTGIWGAC